MRQYQLFALAVVLLVITLLSSSAILPAFATGTAITVGAGPYDEAYDPANGYVYVSDSGDGTVAVINAANTLASGFTNPIPTGSPSGSSSVPLGIAYDAANSYVYVANYNDGTVSVIDTTTNTLATLPNNIANPIPVGTNPFSVLYDPGNGNIYVTDDATNSVYVISNNAVTTTIPGFNVPSEMAYDSSNGDIYVGNTGNNTVSVIDANPSDNTYNTPIGNIGVGNTPQNIVYDPTNNYVYVTNNGDASVSVINPANNGLASGFTNPIPVGNAPFNILYDSANNNLYVANYEDGTVSVISGSTNTVTSTITVGTYSIGSNGYSAIGPAGLALDPTNNNLYVTDNNDNAVYAITLASAAAPTTTTVTVSPAIPIAGRSVTITATISSPSATGTVQFYVDGGAFGSPATVSGGIATISTSSLTAGSHSIYAIYSGDPANAGSTSPTITITVLAPTSGEVTGQGTIGKGQSFELEVSSPDGVVFYGNVDYNDINAKIDLDSKTINLLAIYNSQNSALIGGTATIADNNKQLYNFLVQVNVSSTKNTPDTFSITITDNTGKLVYQNSGNVIGQISINHSGICHNDDDHRHDNQPPHPHFPLHYKGHKIDFKG